MNSKQLVKHISNNINGRMCSLDYIHKLYEVKESLGVFCKKYIEIGVLHGGTMSLLMQSKYKTEFIGIDDFKYYGRTIKKGVQVSLKNAANNIKKFNKHEYKYTLIEGDSQKVFNQVKDKKFQLMLIDGDHTYEGVKKDFELYSSLVEVGGIIFFDDYSHNAWPGVKQACDEFDLNDFELVDKGKYYFIMRRVK